MMPPLFRKTGAGNFRDGMTKDEGQMVDLLMISSGADWPVLVNRIGHVSVTTPNHDQLKLPPF